MKRAYIFLNGELKGRKEFYLKLFESKPGTFFCVDGGARHLKALRLRPDELWGDFDSIERELLQEWEREACQLYRFPVEKDFTDFELLLQSLQTRDYEEWIVIGGLGGDSDHLLSNIFLLSSYPKIRFLSEEEEIFWIPREQELEARIGSKISFLALSEEVMGLTLEGFRYPLQNHSLKRASSLCHGNEIISHGAKVSFERGELIAVLKHQSR